MRLLRQRWISRFLLPAVAIALPAVLLYSSVRTLHELDEQRAIYLRHRVSILVSRLEGLGTLGASSDLLLRLAEEEPYLLDVRVVSDADDTAAGDLSSIWTGRELFRTEMNGQIFRTHVPFHANGAIHIARIDMNSAAADFLLVHGRHNVIVSSIGGMVLVGLALYSMWSIRRASRLQMRQLELEHLAHIGKMSAVLAHEIRNPLGTIKGFIQLAGEHADLSTRSLLDRAVVETQRLEHLVKDLLAYGRPSAPQWRDVSWREVAPTVEAHAQQLIGTRSIQLTISDQPIVWSSDPELLEQALLNLIRNGIEAIPEGTQGQVEVLAEAKCDGHITISVRDTGSGIAETVRQRLFEPFLTTKASGTGLGLAITRKVTEALGGSLELLKPADGGTQAVLRFNGTAKRGIHAIDTDCG